MATDKVPAREAAQRLGMSPQGVYSAFKAGRLAGEYRTSGDALRGGSLWIAVDEIERFAAVPRTRGRPRRVEAAAKIEKAKRRESIVETRGLAFPPGTEPGLIRDTLDELCQTVE